ncbi:MAG: nucleotidyltransferase family protein [Bacteroidales bacterium]|nr:nucleotidyltransferase family protein [Bacteroidales bacterium]
MEKASSTKANLIRITFIELLQLSLGLIDRLSVTPDAQQWEILFRQAKRQSLLGVCFDGVCKLPQEQIPPRELRHKWFVTINKMQAQNKMMCSMAARLTREFNSKGVRSCVLKGVGMASYYPSPLLRQNGDIDIWIDCDRKTAVRLTSEITPVQQVVYHHLIVEPIEDIEVEVHTTPSWLCNPFLNKEVQKWFAQTKDAQMGCRVENYWDGGEEYFNHPEPGFDLVYAMLHIFRHLCDEGVGLRHIVDYYFILKASSKQDREQAAKMLEQFQLGRILGAVCHVMKALFLMDDELLPVKPDASLGEKLMREMWRGGNFGISDPRNRHSQNENILGRFIRKQKRQLDFARTFPKEVPWIGPWRAWHLAMRIKWNGLKVLLMKTDE